MPAVVSRAGDSDVFYVVASTGCDQWKCLRMYRTDLNLSSFTRVTPPPVTGERGGLANTTLDHLVFANKDDGFATAGSSSASALYITTNGAKTWQRVMDEKGLNITVTVTSSEVIVTTRHCTVRSTSCGQFTTMRSPLAATHWVTMPRLWKTGTGKRDVYYGPSVAAYGHTVWELETGRAIRLWTSHDNGQTFTQAKGTVPELGSVAGCSLYPMSELSLWAECPTGMAVSFWYSSDGGVTWTQVPTTQFMGTGGGAFAPVTSGLAYLDYGAVAKDPNFFRISDGVHETAVGEVRCEDAYELDFVNESHGLMLCSQYPVTSLRRTNNGGVTWTTVSLP